MIIENAKQAENNISADNIFYVYDDNYKPIGKATTCTFENYTDFDAFPTNFYFDIHKGTVNDEARALLLGAVIAKGYLYSAQHPYHSTKIYTNIDPHDNQLVSFFSNSGLQFGECEEELLLYPPAETRFKPKEKDCTVSELKMNNIEDITQLCNRMNQYLLTPISHEKIIRIAQAGHPIKVFVTTHNGNTVAECAFFVRPLRDEFGDHSEEREDSREAVLIGLYTQPIYRRYGIATNLLSLTYKYLVARGITFLRAKLQRRSRSQKALASKCHARSLGISYYCPRIEEVKRAAEGAANPQISAAQLQSAAIQQAQASVPPTVEDSPNPSRGMDWNALYKQAYPSRRGR